jgi:hypothetical protein
VFPWEVVGSRFVGKFRFALAAGFFDQGQCLQVIVWLASTGGMLRAYNAEKTTEEMRVDSLVCDERGGAEIRNLRPAQYPATKSTNGRGWWILGPEGLFPKNDGTDEYLAMGPLASQNQCAAVLGWMNVRKGDRMGFLSRSVFSGTSRSGSFLAFIRDLSCVQRK